FYYTDYQRRPHDRWNPKRPGGHGPWYRSSAICTGASRSSGAGYVVHDERRGSRLAERPPFPIRPKVGSGEGSCRMADPIISASPNQVSGVLDGETILLSSTTNLYY